MKMRNCFQWSILLFALLFLTLYTETVADAMHRSLHLCATTVIPSLFPYLVLSNLLSDCVVGEIRWLNKLFGVCGNGAPAILLGFFGGYPTGAKAISNLYKQKQISKIDAQRLLFFACNAGPAFISGMVGGMLYRSNTVGFALFFIQLLSAFLSSCILPKESQACFDRKKVCVSQMPFSSAFTRAITDAALTMLKICAFICFFSIILQLESLILGNSTTFLVLSSITELTAGISNIAQAEISWTLKFVLTASCISFGGICVLLQTMSVLDGSGLSISYYLRGKLVQALISALLAWPVSYILSTHAAVGNFPVDFVPLSPWPWTLFSVLLVFLIFRKFTTSNYPASGL